MAAKSVMKYSWPLLGLFGFPLFVFFFYTFYFPMAFLSGLGNVGDPPKIDQIGNIWKVLYLNHPYWIPITGLFFFPAIVKTFKKWWIWLLLLVVYMGFVWEISQDALMVLNLELS